MVVLSSRSLALDVASRTLQVKGGRRTPLPRRQFQILEALMRRSLATVGTNELLGMVWGRLDAAPADALKKHVQVLRDLVEADRAEPRLIVTARGSGYRFAERVTERSAQGPALPDAPAPYTEPQVAPESGPNLGPITGQALLDLPDRSAGSLALSPAALSVRVDGEQLPLMSSRVFLLLYRLVGRADRLVTWREVERWCELDCPSASPGPCARETMGALGKRVRDAGAQRYLRAVHGEGVVLQSQPPDEPDPAAGARRTAGAA